MPYKLLLVILSINVCITCLAPTESEAGKAIPINLFNIGNSIGEGEAADGIIGVRQHDVVWSTGYNPNDIVVSLNERFKAADPTGYYENNAARDTDFNQAVSGSEMDDFVDQVNAVIAAADQTPSGRTGDRPGSLRARSPEPLPLSGGGGAALAAVARGGGRRARSPGREPGGALRQRPRDAASERHLPAARPDDRRPELSRGPASGAPDRRGGRPGRRRCRVAAGECHRPADAAGGHCRADGAVRGDDHPTEGKDKGSARDPQTSKRAVERCDECHGGSSFPTPKYAHGECTVGYSL